MIGGAVKKTGIYKLAYSQDPALELPEESDARSLALRVARETGDWASITKPNEKLSLFSFRPLDSESIINWQSSHHDKSITDIDLAGWSALVLGALVAVENVEGAVVRREDSAIFGTAADPVVLDALPRDHLFMFVQEMGFHIMTREFSLGPKS